MINELKVLVYCHDTFGLGHISRAIKLSKGVNSVFPNPSITIVTGSSASGIFNLPDNTDLIKMLTLQSRRINDKLDYVANNNLAVKIVINLREKILLQTVMTIKPDILIVDFSPKGVQNELLPALDYIRKHLDTKILLTFRDIIGAPNETIEKWKRRNYEDIIEKYYDYVLIFGEQKIYDLGEEYSLQDRTRLKIRYLGYLVDSHILNKQRKGTLICCGGGRDGLLAIKKAMNLTYGKRTIVTGPKMSERDFQSLKDCGNSIILRETDKLAELMASSEKTICMCGYNTFTEILQTETPSFVIPRVFPESEQLIRATIFQDLGILKIIDSNFTKKNMKRDLSILKETLSTEINKINCNGIVNFANFLSGIVN